ncbi:MAG: DedA family protein [bacterium]|nr:DedA family protein [bacterium]
MLRRTYDWVMKYSSHPRARWVLSAVSFAESSFFPLPPDPLYMAMALKDRSSIWRLAFLCTLTSVVGGYVGYLIGYSLYETWGQGIIEFYGLKESFGKLREDFAEWGFWIIALKGLTPIPFKIVTIASGVAAFDLWTFTFASILARGFRFFYVGLLLWYFGPQMRDYIERNLTLVTTISLAVLIGGFIVIKYLW